MVLGGNKNGKFSVKSAYMVDQKEQWRYVKSEKKFCQIIALETSLVTQVILVGYPERYTSLQTIMNRRMLMQKTTINVFLLCQETAPIWIMSSWSIRTMNLNCFSMMDFFSWCSNKTLFVFKKNLNVHLLGDDGYMDNHK